MCVRRITIKLVPRNPWYYAGPVNQVSRDSKIVDQTVYSWALRFDLASDFMIGSPEPKTGHIVEFVSSFRICLTYKLFHLETFTLGTLFCAKWPTSGPFFNLKLSFCPCVQIGWKYSIFWLSRLFWEHWWCLFQYPETFIHLHLLVTLLTWHGYSQNIL